VYPILVKEIIYVAVHLQLHRHDGSKQSDNWKRILENYCSSADFMVVETVLAFAETLLVRTIDHVSMCSFARLIKTKVACFYSYFHFACFQWLLIGS
jgi:hypothetical protein